MTISESVGKVRALLKSEPTEFITIVRKSGVSADLVREILLDLQRNDEADLVHGLGWYSTDDDASHVYRAIDVEESWTELEDGTKYLSFEINRDEDDIEVRFTADEARDLALSIFKEVGTITGDHTVFWVEGDLVEHDKNEYGVVHWKEQDNLVVKVPGDDENRKWPAAQCRLLRRG